MKFDFDRLTNAVCAETPEELLYIKLCKKYGLPSNLLHKTIYSVKQKTELEVIGLVKVGRFAYVLGKYTYDDITDPIPIDIRKVLNKTYYMIEG